MHSSRRDLLTVFLLAAAVSVGAFIYYLKQNELLLYGDAVAHIGIARRVVDSRTPGPLQLGTVWLPLPHVLMLPFVAKLDWWQSGAPASVPSMAAFVLGAIGIYRLVRGYGSRMAAWIATLIYTLNPNLLYMQSTAMTESIFLAGFVWTAVYLAEFRRKVKEREPMPAARALQKCGLAAAATVWTRYDGWFLAAVLVALAALVVWWHAREVELRRGLRDLAVLALLPGALWMAYNFFVFSNPLEFATGPYSARAIAERTTPKGSPPHPGYHSPVVAKTYFLKTAKLNVAEGRWENLLLIAAVLGTLAVLMFAREMWPLLLLWAPVPFYALSMAYGGVPIFIPQWWPFSYYNVRYGLQLLPAFAVFAGALYAVVAQRLPRAQAAVGLALVAITGLGYASVWRATPITLREARVNSVTREALEQKLAAELRALPGSAIVLMHTGSYVGALQKAGFPIRQTINEGNYKLWEAALAAPEQYVDFAVAVEGDEVARAMASRSDRLEILRELHSEGKPPARIYRVKK